MSCGFDAEDICKCHPLKAVCVVIQLIESHLTRRQWMSPYLAEQLPNTTPILFQDAADKIKRSEATPLVAFGIKGASLSNTQRGALSAAAATRSICGTTIQMDFVVSTNSKGLTRELSFELGGLLMAISGPLREYEANISNVTVGATDKDESNQFYLSSVSTTMGVGYQIWKTDTLTSTLREIRLEIDNLYNQQL